jgi:hypothetical protein
MALNALLVDSGEPKTRTSYRADLTTVLLGVWFVVGLFLDAWAHNNLPGLETFFTPWHAVFYTGFVATAGWLCWLVARNLLAGRRGAAAVPVGHGLSVIGLPVFALAGLLDFGWHTVFGIEQAYKILFSPTHLVLVSSMIVIVTSPLRAAWADRDRVAPGLVRLLPAILALAFTTTLVLLFLQYANALIWGPHAIVANLSESPDGRPKEIEGFLAAIMVTNLVLIAPLLLAGRRWRIPPGTATIIFLTAAGLCAAITSLRALSVLVVMLVAGLLVDVVAARLDPRDTRRGAYLAFGFVAPVLLWSAYLGVAAVYARQLPDIVEFWTGIPVVAGFLGLILAALMVRHPSSVGIDRIPDRDQAHPVAARDEAHPVAAPDGSERFGRDEVQPEQRPVG